MDNRIFNVNGRLDRGGEELLKSTLRLAFAIMDKTAKAWRVTKKSGLILDWWDSEGANKLPSPLDADGAFALVLPWLRSDEAKETTLDRWDEDYDHDGENGPGWRVYCGAWGYVEGHQAIVAVKPVFMWYGK